jgi:hypothetical protein
VQRLLRREKFFSRKLNKMKLKKTLLRTYQFMAQKEHTCNMCGEFIHPGDIYEGFVKVVNGKLQVSKYHLDPFCPLEDDDWLLEYEEQRELEKLVEETILENVA